MMMWNSACLVRLWLMLMLATLGGISNAWAITPPIGLNAGDQYRLAFVTSTERDGLSANIADYNAHVTAAASGVPELLALGTTWRAIASTAVVAARDNTNTNPDETGVPIYLLNGVQLASGNADLWDGTISVPLDVDEH